MANRSRLKRIIELISSKYDDISLFFRVIIHSEVRSGVVRDLNDLRVSNILYHGCHYCKCYAVETHSHGGHAEEGVEA